MKKSLLLICLAVITTLNSAVFAQQKKNAGGECYKISVYHYSSGEQERALDEYLQRALLPALHRFGHQQVGVFKPIANDTAKDKKIYVFANGKSLDQLGALEERIMTDATFRTAAKQYLEIAYNQPAFNRMEVILLRAFRMAPRMQLPVLQSPKESHVYELRSYESPTEDLYRNKVHMFNEGGEVALFLRLGFNAVFYADVVSGCRMPNLMYMTSFDNMEAREAHWKSFTDDPEWKRLSGLPEYQHNVSKADIILMRAAPYSDF